jgi:outer membrane protein with beta-barrel domain
MNRFIAILTVCITVLSSARAQVSFGAKAGAAITSLPGDYSNFSKVGFYGGITGELPVGKKFSIAAELVYSLQGNKQRIKFSDWAPTTGSYQYDEKAHMNLSYINLPVLVKYQFVNNVFIETGLQAGLLAGAKVKTSDGSGDIKDNYESFDLSWPVGIGFKLNNGLGANLRYNVGLTSVYKGTLWEPKNRVLQLGIFYMLKKH